jgi:hypothetical protein
MKRILGVLVAVLAIGIAGAAEAKTKRKVSSVEDCTEKAGKAAEHYLHDKMTGGMGGKRHELYKKFAGKNGYNAIVYTYMYKVLDAGGGQHGILRVTMNHACEMTTAGGYKDEKDMEADDQDAAETPVE